MILLNPILSICIPTYNRAEILRHTLEHYFESPECDETIEVIVSDNASTDDTQLVCEHFSRNYSNFKYYRNEENVRDANFAIVLDYAKGEYVKLMNDTIYIPTEGLRLMKQQIHTYSKTKEPIFFITGPVYERIKQRNVRCANLNEYIGYVSLFCTAINMFGTWREDWQKIDDKTCKAHLQLAQVDWTYQIIERNNGCRLLYIEPFWWLTEGSQRKFSESYNFFQIHLANYNAIQQVYLEKGLISPNTIRKDGRVFLRHYRKKIGQVLFGRRIDGFDYNGAKQILMHHFSKDWYFYWFIVSYPFWYVGDVMRRVKNKIKKICVR